MTRILIALLLLIPQETLQVKVSLVTVGVRVTDSRGRSISNLKAEDFSIFDDEVPQKIEFFSSDEQPITLGIVLDRSFSMSYNQKLDRAKEAAQALVRATHAGSEYFYIAFDDQVRIASDFTTERERVESAIAQTSLGGGTSLYDALVQAVAMTGKTQQARQALVVISDGADQHSQREMQDALRVVRESEMQVYTIGYYGPEEERLVRTSGAKIELAGGRMIDNPRKVLERIASESGAESFFPRSDVELAKAVQSIADDLRTQYTLSFYPQTIDPESRYHQLRVAVPGRYHVRSRPGYGTVQVGPPVTQRASSRAWESKVERRDGRTFYEDNFTDPNSGWPDRISARYSRDGYKLSGENVVTVNGPTFRNFRAAVSLTASANGAGIIFRQSDRGYYTFAVSPESASVNRVETIKTTPLDRWPLTKPNGVSSRIEVRCEDVDCAFYQDETLIGKIKDTTFSEGRVGLYVSGKGNATFNDLKVEEIK
jgi:Ca-activated chloride channel family protein